jgi:hypothetical protein
MGTVPDTLAPAVGDTMVTWLAAAASGAATINPHINPATSSSGKPPRRIEVARRVVTSSPSFPAV